MSINRTRDQKQQAAIERSMQNGTILPVSLRVGNGQTGSYSRELVLPVEGIKKDLAKTILITVIALLFQGGLFIMLARGVIKLPGV